MSEIIAYEVDGNPLDIEVHNSNNLQGTPIYLDNSPQSLEIIRHSTAHLMAHAIKRIYKDAQFFVGPVVEDGFYYDFRVQEKISEADLKEIEKMMLQIAKERVAVERYELSKAEVSEKFKEDDLKQEVLKRIPEGAVSIYKQDDFDDICRGPHVPNMGLLRNFKLTRVAGAYLGGDENREMLTRISIRSIFSDC